MLANNGGTDKTPHNVASDYVASDLVCTVCL